MDEAEFGAGMAGGPPLLRGDGVSSKRSPRVADSELRGLLGGDSGDRGCLLALAASRTRVHLLVAMTAGAGLYVLVLPGPSSDYPGIDLALVAAACLAAYILLNRLVGARLPGLQAPAVATSISALLYLPVLFALGAQGRLSAPPPVYAITAGVLSSVVPYAADLTALRHVPARFFGTFMSVHSVWAALAGIAVLGQVPASHEWIGIGLVVLSNAVAVITVEGGHGLPAVPRNQGQTPYESSVAIPVE